MIAQRFRPIGTVALVATATIGLYLISLQVAAKRGQLDAVESQIAHARHDIRQLQTEFGTRASMRQLEQWNGQVLALSAPKAKQFVRDGIQLAALDPYGAPADVAAHLSGASPPVVAAAQTPKSPRTTTTPVTLSRKREAKPVMLRGDDVKHANFLKPRDETPQRLQRVAMVDAAFGRALIRAAEVERRKRP
jgi:hypothetical protein